MTELGTIDRETGAPTLLRAVIGGISKPEDRLAELQKVYDTVIPDPEDKTNLLFVSPKTGRLTAYNPSGLDLGDVASVAREGTQVVGSIAGATAGVPGGLPGIAAGSVLGGMAGEELFQLVLKGMGVQDTRSLKEKIGETAYIGATSLGGPAGAATQQVGASAIKTALRGPSGAGVQRIIDDAARFGFEPSVATATANKTLDMLETMTARTPGGFGVLKKSVDKTLTAIRSSIDDQVKKYAGGAVDKVRAGRVVREGIEGFVARFNTKATNLYDEININAPIEVPNTRRALTELLAPIPDAPALTETLRNKGLAAVDKAFTEDVSDLGTMSFAAMKKLRSVVGKKIANSTLVDEVPKSEWKRLYGALSEDMKAAAKKAGPEAEKAFSRANNFWKAGTERVDDFLQPIANKITPEEITNTLRAGFKNGPTKIRAIRRSLTKEQWKVVAGNYFVEMGHARPGQMVEESTGFSFDGFLTKWHELGKDGQDAMFGNMGELEESVNALVDLATSVRESGQAFANPSGTAGSMIGQTMMYGSVGSVPAALLTGHPEGMFLFPALTAFGALGANRMAALFTNQTFVKWLAASAKIKPNGIGAHIGRLAQIAASGDLNIKEAVLEYSNMLLGGVAAKPDVNKEAADTPAIGP